MHCLTYKFYLMFLSNNYLNFLHVYVGLRLSMVNKGIL